MFVKDTLQELYAPTHSNFPATKFLLMLISAVIDPFVMFAVGGRTLNTLWQPGLMMFKSGSYIAPPAFGRPNFS